jgi:hypothetical protein
MRVSDGNEEWVVSEDSANRLAVDTSDDVYVPQSSPTMGARKLTASGSWSTTYPVTKGRWIGFRDLVVNELNNLLIGVGAFQNPFTLETAKVMVWDLTTAGVVWEIQQDTAAAGDLTAAVVSGDYLYVGGSRNTLTPPETEDGSVWKIALVDTMTASAGDIVGRYDTGDRVTAIWFNNYGNLCVKSDNILDKIFVLNPTDMGLINSADYAMSFYAYQTPRAVQVPFSSQQPSRFDMNPADIIEDLVTHERYGARLTAADYNSTKLAAVWSHWQTNSMLLSLSINDSRPWTDWLDYILAHVGGFRFQSSGQLCIGAIQDKAADDDLFESDLVQPDPEAETLRPKVDTTPRKYSGTYNRIEVIWRDPDYLYDPSVAVAYDRVDQAVSGKLRIKKIKLDGIHSADLAQKMAYRMLIDALYRWNIHKFTVGFNKQLLEPGDVITLDDDHLLTGDRLRILTIQEDLHGRGLEVAAMDDYAGHYPTITYSTQTGQVTAPGIVTLAGGTVYFRESIDSQKIYLSIVPGNTDVNGWYIYQSYDGVSYSLAGRCGISGVTGGSANSAGTTTSSLPGHGVMTWRPDEWVTVDIGTLTDLPTGTSDAAFWADQQIARIGSEIIAYKAAVEITPGIWRISNLRRGLFGTDPAAHSSGETFVTLHPNFTYGFQEADVGTTLHFKVVTYYGQNVQNVADVGAFSVTVQGYYNRPAGVSMMRLTSAENQGGSGLYSGPSFTLHWNLGSRTSGWNWGGWDVSGGGVPWNNYVSDADLQAVVLYFEQTDGTPIGNREISVAESEVITLAGDLGGHSPGVVRVVPRRVLEARRQPPLVVTQV